MIKQFFCFILIALLAGCGNISTTAETTAIIWIAGGVEQDSLLIEVLDNGTIKKISGNVIFDTDTKEVFYGEGIKRKVITLTSTDASTIYELITKIGNGSEDKINPGNDSTEVFALINNKIYWTPLHSSPYQPSNENLLKLTHIFMKGTG